jgi:hypothetical protein
VSALVKACTVLVACGFGCADSAAIEHCDLTAAGESFAALSGMLGARCGSSDCHGQLGRPLRIYSGRSLRLDPEDLSGHGGTRSAEHEANLRSVIGLEPELTCQVLRERGRDPERLSFLRKATGAEAHKGGAPLQMQDDALDCLLGWFAGDLDADSCARASEQERPE